MMTVCDPLTSPESATREDDWSYPFPLNWELQLRYLWTGAADAFGVVAQFLPSRAAPSVLAQIRFLVETRCLVKWLAEPEEARQARGYRWTINELRDVRRILMGWSGHEEDKTPTLQQLKTMEKEVKQRATDDGVPLPKQPNMRSLLMTYGYGYTVYAVLSDLGSHPGFASSLAFFRVPGKQKIDINLDSGKVSRAYFLGLAYEAFGKTVGTVAAARGWDELSSDVRDRINAAGPTLLEATNLVVEGAS